MNPNDIVYRGFGLGLPFGNPCSDTTGTSRGKSDLLSFQRGVMPCDVTYQQQRLCFFVLAAILRLYRPDWALAPDSGHGHNQRQSSGLQVPTSTSLLVVLAPITGGINTSFAEISVVVFTDGTGIAAELSSSGTVKVFDQGNQLGTSKLLPVNGSSLPGACAGMATTRVASVSRSLSMLLNHRLQQMYLCPTSHFVCRLLAGNTVCWRSQPDSHI